MKKFKLLPINIGFDDDYKNLPYRQEAQDLYLLLSEYDEAIDDIDNEEINEPNLDLIKNLVKSFESLNDLEFIMALKQIQKLEKPYPITINFSKDLSTHYKSFAKIITALKDSSPFTNLVKILNARFDDTSNEFISYVNGFNILFKYFKYDAEELWEHLKHFRQRKYILNFDKPISYLNWHLEQDLFGELKDNGEAVRAVNVDVFDLITAKKLSTIQIIIHLKTTENEYTQDAYQIGFEPVSIEYKYIKSCWVEEYGEELVNDFKNNSKPCVSKDLTKYVANLLDEEKTINPTNEIEFQKYLVSLHNDCNVKPLFKRNCKYKDNNSKPPCNKEFLTYKKKAAFCYECVNKPDLNAQRTRIHRERKAREACS